MNPQELNLLLYLECMAVDYGGKIDQRRINDQERDTLNSWANSGFIQYGRIAAADIVPGLTHWTILSDKAWDAAHNERRARHNRMMQNRKAEFIGLKTTD